MEKINIFSVAVVLPDFIERFLDTLEGNTEPNYEVILVDNSRDGIERIVQRRVSCILRPGYNLSFAKSHNTALRLATTTYLTVCPDLVIVDETVLRGLVHFNY